jgi:hypothetical protein
MATLESPPFCTPAGDGVRFKLSLHPGQRQAMESTKRFVLILAGSQSGKTCLGPPWLLRETASRGPGDYLCVAPSYPLMQKKVLPEFLNFFATHAQRGEYKAADRIFLFRDGQTKVFFGHADDPESLESATAKAAWLDEAGQKRFRFGSWEAVIRRLAIYQGRVLVTTTPYGGGWLKQQLFDPWTAAHGDHPEIEVINFDSTANPVFPVEEYEAARRTMPPWRFNMFYRGRFERPAGLIYQCFDDTLNVCPRFQIPPDWPRYLGLDFGGVNTAGVFLAEEPHSTPTRYYAYREYLDGGKTAAGHAAAMLRDERVRPRLVVGGSKSEGQWRAEFAVAGLPVLPPDVTDVEVGIDRVYGAVAERCLVVFDDLAGLRDEFGSYSRPTDERGEPTEGIEDKEIYHRLDAVRYIVGWLRRGMVAGTPTSTTPPGRPSFRPLGRPTFNRPTFRGR